MKMFALAHSSEKTFKHSLREDSEFCGGTGKRSIKKRKEKCQCLSKTDSCIEKVTLETKDITLFIQNRVQEIKSVESEAQVIALKKASLAYVNLP